MVDLLEDEEEEEQSDKKEDIDGNEILDYALMDSNEFRRRRRPSIRS
jgi:hypothetical protein